VGLVLADADMKPQPKASTQEVLAGLVERVTDHNAENGFCVLRAGRLIKRFLTRPAGYSAPARQLNPLTRAIPDGECPPPSLVGHRALVISSASRLGTQRGASGSPSAA